MGGMESEWAKIKNPLIYIAIILLVVIAAGYIATFYLDPSACFSYTLVAVTLITFFGFLMMGDASEKPCKVTEESMRNAITASVIVLYFTLLITTIFMKQKELRGLSETLVTNFTTVVGIVIAFYFGTSAYLQYHKGEKCNNKDKKES